MNGPARIADDVRDIVDALHYLTQAVQAVKSIAMGGDYEDLPIWDIEQCLARLDARIDGGVSGRG